MTWGFSHRPKPTSLFPRRGCVWKRLAACHGAPCGHMELGQFVGDLWVVSGGVFFVKGVQTLQWYCFIRQHRHGYNNQTKAWFTLVSLVLNNVDMFLLIVVCWALQDNLILHYLTTFLVDSPFHDYCTSRIDRHTRLVQDFVSNSFWLVSDPQTIPATCVFPFVQIFIYQSMTILSQSSDV